MVYSAWLEKHHDQNRICEAKGFEELKKMGLNPKFEKQVEAMFIANRATTAEILACRDDIESANDEFQKGVQIAELRAETQNWSFMRQYAWKWSANDSNYKLSA